MAVISFNTACKELKIAHIVQLNQLFQLLHLAHMYGHGFYEVSGMLMRKNVNNDVSKDSPIQRRYFGNHILEIIPFPDSTQKHNGNREIGAPGKEKGSTTFKS